MATDSNLQFIREKIYNIRSAIMYTMSNELVKLPNNIVTAVKVDEEGQLWFLSKRPLQFVSECEQVFPARLRFYRKGVSFSVEVSGKAIIMGNAYSLNPEQENTDSIEILKEKPVLVKMSMTNIEYIKLDDRKKNRVELLLDQGYNWLLKTVAVQRHSKPFLAKLNSHHQ